MIIAVKKIYDESKSKTTFELYLTYRYSFLILT